VADEAGPATGRAGHDPMAALNEYEVRHLAEHLESLGDLHSLDRILRLEWAEQAAGGFPQSGLAAGPPQPGERARCHLAWFDAKNRLNLAADFVTDVHRAWRLAGETTDDALNRGDPAPSIALEIRYALISGSVVSIAGNIPSHLLASLVEHGIWPPGQALAYARSISSSHDRFYALRCATVVDARTTVLVPATPRGQRTQQVARRFESQAIFICRSPASSAEVTVRTRSTSRRRKPVYEGCLARLHAESKRIRRKVSGNPSSRSGKRYAFFPK